LLPHWDLHGIQARFHNASGVLKFFISKMTPTVECFSVRPLQNQKMLPVDRSFAFSQRAREKINTALIRCEERYPKDASHSLFF
jgi:hypothetical protein